MSRETGTTGTTPANEGGQTAKRGLVGRTVAILEARRSVELAKLIEQRGATVYVAPALREEPAGDSAEITGFIDAVCTGSFDLVLFLTGVGVRTLFAAAERLGRQDELRSAVERMPVLVRGPKPVAALRALGLGPTFTTASPYTTQQILDAARGIEVGGKPVGVVLHGGPSEELLRGLEALGARVDVVQVYHWALPDDVRPIEGLLERLRSGAIDAVLFTSASQVQNLFAIAEQFGQAEVLQQLLEGAPLIAAVGPVSAAALREHDLRVDVQPADPKMGPLVQALDRAFADSAIATRSPTTGERPL